MGSERVRLEVAILAADEATLENAPPPRDKEAFVILVVAADSDVRRYVQECLRERADVRVLTATTVADALTLAARDAPRVLVVDAPQCEILMALVHDRTIILVDELSYSDRSSESNVRLLVRPFTRAALIHEVDELLATGGR